MLIASLRAGKSRRAILESVGMPRNAFFDDADSALEWCEERLLDGWGERRAGDVEIALQEIELLRGLTPEDIALVSEGLVAHRFAAGDIILREGEPGDRVFFLTKGTASIRVALGEGRSRRLATITPGLAFGEMAMIDGGPRSAELRADRAVHCYSLSVERLREIGRTQPRILTAILGNLARTQHPHLIADDLGIDELAHLALKALEKLRR